MNLAGERGGIGNKPRSDNGYLVPSAQDQIITISADGAGGRGRFRARDGDEPRLRRCAAAGELGGLQRFHSSVATLDLDESQVLRQHPPSSWSARTSSAQPQVHPPPSPPSTC